MKILITGATGMLGKAIVKALKDNHELILTTRNKYNLEGYKTLDIAIEDEVNSFIAIEKPDVIINCAAYTDVKGAETTDDAYVINALGPKYLAAAAKNNNAILVHFSTDYVFSGTKPLNETYNEEVEMKPLNAYGRSKAEGDTNIINIKPNYYIIRTSWLFGDGNNFIETIKQKSQTDPQVFIVDDQWGSPTYTEDLANAVRQVIENSLPFGIYNITNIGYTTWYDFAKLFVDESQCEVVPINSAEYITDVQRPRNSKLSYNKIMQAGIIMPMYEDALDRYLRRNNE